MSKSLGNGIDPLEVIEQYGADALRFTLVTGNTPGNDMRFYMERVEANRNFANKIWNAAKFVLMNLTDYDEEYVPQEDELELVDRWILERLAVTVEHVTENLDKFELGEAADSIYQFIWNSFCDWYIEAVKPRLYATDAPASRQATQYVLVRTLTQALALLHPFMPFVTEHIWQHLPHQGQALAVADWPAADSEWRFARDAEQMERLCDAIRAVRNMRAEAGVEPRRQCRLAIRPKRDDLRDVLRMHEDYFRTLAHAEKVTVLGEEASPENAMTTVTDGLEVYLMLQGLIDIDKENARIAREETQLQKEIDRLEKKLANASFVAKAPAKVVDGEREKLANYQQKLAAVSERRAFLEKVGD